MREKNDLPDRVKTAFRSLEDKTGISTVTLIAVSAILLPAFMALLFITVFGVNVVNYDQYEFIPLLDKLYNGTLSAEDLYSQHNEHRIVVPRLVMLGLASLTHYNTMAEMYFSWIVAASILGLIFVLFRKQMAGSALLLPAFVPVAWLVFSLRQVDNLIWGWQMQIFLSVVAFILALYLLDRSKGFDRSYLAAIVSATVSTFSFVNGLIVWPACMAYLLLARGRKGIRECMLWGLTGAAVWTVYFIGWSSPSNHPSIFYMLNNMPGAVLYLLAIVGSPLAWEKSHAVAVGSVLLAAIVLTLIALAWKRNIAPNAVWITFILFSLASSAACVVGRSGFGVDQALAPRYVTFTSLAVIGLYLIIANSFINRGTAPRESTIMTFSYGMLTGIIIIGLIAGIIGGVYFGISEHTNKTEMKSILANYKTASDSELEKLYPLTEKVRDGAAILEKYRLNVFF